MQRVSRRHVLQVGGLSYFGLSLPGLLRAQHRLAPGLQSRTADACILVFLNGGPSHLDMWDMKPEAPSELRGEFQPIPTRVPGIHLSEHLPKMAELTHLTTVVRSAHHSVNNSHAAAVYAALTGHDRGEKGGGAQPTDNPAIGSVVGKLIPPTTPMLPYVALPYMTKEGAGGPPQPGFFGGWMGRTNDPFWVLRDPNNTQFEVEDLAPPYGVSSERFEDRQKLLQGLSQVHAFDGESSAQNWDVFHQKAFDLMTSPATQRAFHIDQEPPELRDAYGRNIYGQSVLLARRLVEAGTRVATISWAPDANATWDTHGNNFSSLKNTLLPQLDAAVSALLTDLQNRHMLDRTLVVIMGEFGRTPRINGNSGRDHWNACYGLMLAGGGIRGGHVFGASDRMGSQPALDPVTPADLVATIYHCLGIPKDYELRDPLDRPFPVVPAGEVLTDLLVS